MRLDKFLKISLLFKTRSLAEKTIENNNVLLNDKIAKPSSNVKVDDHITIKYRLKTVVYQVNELHDRSVPKKAAQMMRTLIKEETHEL